MPTRRDLLAVAALTAAARAVPAFAGPSEPIASRVRVGQIGTGHGHAGGKWGTLRALADQFEPVGLVEPDPVRRAAAMRQSAYRDARWLSEEELLNTPGLRAVVVETDVAGLVPTAARCVAAGLHVHLDKPPGGTLAPFAALLADAAARGLVLQMGYLLRYNPAIALVRQWAAEGVFGEVHTVHGEMSKLVGKSERTALAEFPGGAMFELGCHLIDSAMSLLGPPEGVLCHNLRTRPDEDTLADNGTALLTYPRATAFVRAAVNEPDGTARRQWHVMGRTGQAAVTPLEGNRITLTLTTPAAGYGRGRHEVKLPAPPGRFHTELTEFARFVRGEAVSPWDAAHDLTVHRTVLAASGVPVG